MASLRVRLSLTLTQKRALPDLFVMSGEFSEPKGIYDNILFVIHFLAAQGRFDLFLEILIAPPGVGDTFSTKITLLWSFERTNMKLSALAYWDRMA